jgi:hypothetical protein
MVYLLLLIAFIGITIVSAFGPYGMVSSRRLNRHNMEIQEFGDDTVVASDDTRTDEEKGLTLGYEGDFKVGEKVRVKISTKVWSVKQYMKEGFDPKGFEGTVQSLALYGRKYKTLCSAITPIRVEFAPDGTGIPAGMFEKKFIAHFSHDEIERVI